MAMLLPTVDLSAVVVGQVGVVDWSKTAGQSASPRFYGPGTIQGATGHAAHLQLYNESGCGLTIQFQSKGDQIFLPAGGWLPAELDPTCTSFTWTVVYILPNAPVTILVPVYYFSYETPPQVPILGNSPVGIGGSVSTTNIQSLTNDGNPAPTSIIESTPTGQGSSSFSLNNDGSGFWQVLSANILRTVISVARGTAVAKAVVQFGDSGDTSITTFYGTIGAGSVIWPSNITLDGTQAHETFAGAGDIFIPHGIHVAGSVFGTGGVITFGDNIDVNEVIFTNTLSSGNKIMDLQQNYGWFSDNTGTLGTTRNWVDGPDRGEFHVGPRTGANYFDWIRLRGTKVTIDLGKNASTNPILFEVTGGKTQLDNNAIHTDGAGNLTAVSFVGNVVASEVTAGNLASGVKQQNGSTIVGINSAGGGAAGTQIWVGTTDPGGSAAEGDIWIPQ